MKKIILANNGLLPLPAVKGGAVEALIDLLVNENEKYGYWRFEVYSNYDKEAVKASNKYKFTNFVYVKQKGLIDKFVYLLVRIYNFFALRLKGHYHPFKYHLEIIKNVKKSPNDYCAILLEGCSVPAAFLKKKTSLPVFQRIHNIPSRGLRQFDVDSAKSTLMYMGISKFICNTLKEFEGNYCKNIELLYNSIDFNLFKKEITQEEFKTIKKRLNFNEDDFVVMFSGRIRDYKGVKELLEAIYKCNDINNLKLLIVGSAWFSSKEKTPFEKSLEPIILSLGDKVKFTGYVKYQDMYKYYRIANICVFPSIWEEPFALTCLEALTCGKPVIITRSGGMVEIVDSNCAIIVPKDNNIPSNLAKGIMELYNNPQKTELMGRAAVERAQLFSPCKQYIHFSDLMNKYLNHNK